MKTRQPLRLRTRSIVLFLYLVLASIFFGILGDAMLNEETSIQFMADSVTYEQAAVDLKDLNPLELIAYNPNYFGPVTILTILHGSRWGVVILNFVVFTLSLAVFFRALPLRKDLFVILLCLNPMTFSSLLSINKELYSLLSVSLIVYGLFRKNFFALAAAVFFSFFVRWQFSFFILAYFGIISAFNPLRRHRLVTFLCFATIISVLYPVLRPIAFSNVSEVASAGGQNWEGTGLWGKLLDVQDAGGYLLVFPIKVLQAMFGILVYIQKIVDPPEFYNYVVVMLHSLVMLGVTVAAFFRSRFWLSNDIFYMIAVYLLVFGLTPIYAPRYFYPVFVLLCVLISQKITGKRQAILDRPAN